MQKPGKKITRRELKEDQLVIYYFKARSFLERHGKTVGFGVLGLIAAAVIVYLVINSRIQANIAASNSLFQAQMFMNRGEFQPAQEQLKFALEAYSGTRNATEALLLLARVHYKTESYDSAEYYADRFLKKGSGNSILMKSKFKEAGDSYSAAAHRFPRQFTAPMYLLDAARCYELAGERQSAIASCEELIHNYPESEVVGRANQQLARAGGRPEELPVKVEMF